MVERVAEEVRQPHHHVTGDGRLLDSGHISHALQRVEQKMRVDLPFQVLKLILRLFLFDLCQPGFVCEEQVVVEECFNDEHNDAIA